MNSTKIQLKKISTAVGLVFVVMALFVAQSAHAQYDSTDYFSSDSGSGDYFTSSDNSSTDFFTSDNDSSNYFTQDNTSTGYQTYQNTSTNYFTPPDNTSTNYQTYQNTSTNYFTPENTSTNYFTQDNTSTNYFTPPDNTSTNYFTPENSSTNYFTPENSSTNYYTPDYAVTGYYSPVEYSASEQYGYAGGYGSYGSYGGTSCGSSCYSRGYNYAPITYRQPVTIQPTYIQPTHTYIQPTYNYQPTQTYQPNHVQPINTYVQPTYAYQPTHTYQPTYTQPSYNYVQPTQVYQPTYVQPYVAPTYYSGTGVSLAQVPYTGLESNVKAMLFTLALIVWSAIVTYIVIGRKKSKLALAAVSSDDSAISENDETNSAVQDMLMGHDNALSNLESFARSQNVIVSSDALSAIVEHADHDQGRAETLLSSLANRHSNGEGFTTIDLSKVQSAIG